MIPIPSCAHTERRRFAERLTTARSILSYALDRAAADPEGVSGPRTRASAFARVALLLAKVGNADEATTLSREAALKLGVDPTQLWIESQRLQSALARPTASPSPATAPPAPRTTRHRDLVTLLLHSMEARRELLPLIDESDLGDRRLRQLVERLRRAPDADPATRMSELPDDARNLLATLLIEERRREDVAAAIRAVQGPSVSPAAVSRRCARTGAASRRPRRGRESTLPFPRRIVHSMSEVGGCTRCARDCPVARPRDVGSPKESRGMSEEPRLEELDRLITIGKQKGFLTYDEVNDALPSDIVSLDQLDDIMMMFGAMDIEVVDSAKAGRLPSEVVERPAPVEDDDDGPVEPIDLTPGPVGRTEDPVRLYLREMGRVSLLTREGEIALAKRIEEGKEQVTRAILSTNLALERFRELRDATPPRRDPRQGRGGDQRGGIQRREGGGADARRSSPASPRSTACCASATGFANRPRGSARRTPARRGSRARSPPGSGWRARPSSVRARCSRPCAS